MNIAVSEALSVALALLQGAIAEEPALAADLQKLFASGNPSPADYEALKASVSAETYGQFVPATALPPAAVV